MFDISLLIIPILGIKLIIYTYLKFSNLY